LHASSRVSPQRDKILRTKPPSPSFTTGRFLAARSPLMLMRNFAAGMSFVADFLCADITRLFLDICDFAIIRRKLVEPE